MYIIPAIDLKDGVCVRLRQGRKEDVTVYSDDPALTARSWESAGAKVLHVVDLDGAFSGSQKNFQRIVEIRKAVRMQIEVGGGIRNIGTVDKLISSGVDRVIIGTAAIEDPEFLLESCGRFPGRIFVGIDARDGKVATRGWEETTELDALELARRIETIGVGGIIYTDISRDGMMTGPNIPALEEMVKAIYIPVIASGGISSVEDIKRLLEIPKLWGAITGKAIYERTLDLKEAIKLSETVRGKE